MLLKEIIAVYSKNHTKHINNLCGQNADLLNVNAGGTYSYYMLSRVNTYLPISELRRHLLATVE
jgi:hypothetical protein